MENLRKTMTQNEYALKVQVGVGRDLRLPQYSSLQVCRDHAELVLQMFEDGYPYEQAIEEVKARAGDVDEIKNEKRMAASFW